MTVADQIEFDPEAALRRGDEEDEFAGKGGGYRKEPYWRLDKGDTAILRFLQESSDWYKARTHRFYPTKAAPADAGDKWPSAIPATCRQEPAFAHLYPNGCPICTSGYKGDYGKGSRADDVRYTLAVEREEYTNEAGKKAYRDKQVEVPIIGDDGKPTEEKITVPSIVIVSQTMFMMMNSLKACGDSYESLRDRDYKIKRVASTSGSATSFQVLPLDKDPGIVPGSDHWNFYDLALDVFDIKLATLIYSRSTDDYYNRFFLEADGFTSVDARRENGELAPAAKSAAPSGKSGGTQRSSSASANPPNAAALAAMRERIGKQANQG